MFKLTVFFLILLTKYSFHILPAFEQTDPKTAIVSIDAFFIMLLEAADLKAK